MLEIADYRVDGQILRVRLRCTCGGRRMLKQKEGDEVYYRCAKCRSKATMKELKSSATAHWRGRTWAIEAEKVDTSRPLEVEYPATLAAQAHRQDEPFCTLSGRVVLLDTLSLTFLAEDFQKPHFDAMTAGKQHAVVEFDAPVPRGLPEQLHGAIVEIKFREEELPRCRVGVALRELSAEEEQALAAYVESLRGTITQWSAE